ncbi:MAG: CBS domain-containing protein [Nitrospiraceae bacterium]|nr:CBS domain-containing protein [Nitrospiraceae bacterium]
MPAAKNGKPVKDPAVEETSTVLKTKLKAGQYQVVARTKLGGAPIRRFMTPNPATVPSDLALDVLVEEHFYRSWHEMYPVMEDTRLIGCVHSKQVAGIPRDQWTQLTVRDILTPCSPENTIAADTDALAALSIMKRTGTSRLLVLEDDARRRGDAERFAEITRAEIESGRHGLIRLLPSWPSPPSLTERRGYSGIGMEITTPPSTSCSA